VPLVVFALCLTMFSLGCVEPLPLPKGSETCSSSSDLALCLSFGFQSLVEVSFSRFFSFTFLFGYKSCLCCQCTHQGGD
jgi:hypothetical protein